jgi:hypothetical protein
MEIVLRNIPVYYINLDEENEKRKSTESMLKCLGFINVNRVQAIKHEKGRIVGCARSHHQILSSYEPPFIILEDHCQLNGSFIDQISVPNDTDALYLGNSHWGRYLNHSGPFVHYEAINDNLMRVYNMLATHSILYWSREYVNFCERISHYYGYKIEDHLDIGFAEVQRYFNVLALNKPLFSQYEWSQVTTKKLSDCGLDHRKASELFERVNREDDNFYKINQTFRTPFKPLTEIFDGKGVPGYFLPTRLI